MSSQTSNLSDSARDSADYTFPVKFEDEGTVGKFGYLKEKKVCYVRSVEPRYSRLMMTVVVMMIMLAFSSKSSYTLSSSTNNNNIFTLFTYVLWT